MSKELEREITQLHAEVCQGIADPKRILILQELSEGRKNVSQLAEALGMGQATVSRRLKVLRDRAMAMTEREGVYIYYSLVDRRIIHALDLLREVVTSILDREKSWRGRSASDSIRWGLGFNNPVSSPLVFSLGLPPIFHQVLRFQHLEAVYRLPVGIDWL